MISSVKAEDFLLFLSSLSRFHTLSTNIEKAGNLEDIWLLVGELEREMSLLSVSGKVNLSIFCK